MTKICPKCGDRTNIVFDMRHQGIFACRCGREPRIAWNLTDGDRKFLRGSRIMADEDHEEAA